MPELPAAEELQREPAPRDTWLTVQIGVMLAIVVGTAVWQVLVHIGDVK